MENASWSAGVEEEAKPIHQPPEDVASYSMHVRGDFHHRNPLAEERVPMESLNPSI